MILETARLRLREFDLSDADFIIELLNTEGFLKNIGDRKVRTILDAHQYLVNGPIKSYRDNGYGLYAVELKATHGLVGMAGLVKRDVFEYADLGFALLPEHFRKGYALEAASGILEYAKSTLKMNRVLGITKVENLVSIQVLLKCGMSFEGPFKLYPDEDDGKLFTIKL